MNSKRRYFFLTSFSLAVSMESQSTVAEKYKPSMLADFSSMVTFLFCARNVAVPPDKS